MLAPQGTLRSKRVPLARFARSDPAKPLTRCAPRRPLRCRPRGEPRRARPKVFDVASWRALTRKEVLDGPKTIPEIVEARSKKNDYGGKLRTNRQEVPDLRSAPAGRRAVAAVHLDHQAVLDQPRPPAFLLPASISPPPHKRCATVNYNNWFVNRGDSTSKRSSSIKASCRAAR